ncbi:hypothetical protein MYK68_18900 [Gordonia sp. PP30]|nr:hypothetical protein [Gordonia sp. PP30]UQE74751.1 hypothetical protein MYK68_18900 [Gordonia sp. PP30]
MVLRELDPPAVELTVGVATVDDNPNPALRAFLDILERDPALGAVR